MKVINATQHDENGRTLVTMRFKTKDQLLNPDDPSPLQERELTQEAEEAILVTCLLTVMPVTRRYSSELSDATTQRNLSSNSQSFSLCAH
jgi:hypothetical protein